MNREGAETFLRLLAEAQLRGPATTGRRASSASNVARLGAVAQALAAVRAFEPGFIEDFLTDFQLAVSARRPPDRPTTGVAGPAVGRLQMPPSVLFSPSAFLGRRRAARAPVRAERPEPGGPEPGGPDRLVPVGRYVRCRDEGLNVELYLLSFAHIAGRAWFTVAWQHHGSPGPRPGPGRPSIPPFDQLTVTDDRGGRYALNVVGYFGSDGPAQFGLHPEPPQDLRWLDVSAPGGPVVRVDLATPASAEPVVSEAELSPGEHLLVMLAERLLGIPPEYLGTGAAGMGPTGIWAVGIGDVIAALEAAEVLSPLSPMPGRLAAVCAGLRVSGHGITVLPSRDLPETWLSLLAYYQRRKPDTTPVRDGFAAIAAALPELDGVRLALLGLNNTDGNTCLQVMARGLSPGQLDVDYYFPVSVWVRDSDRWHLGRQVGWNRTGDEYSMKLQLTPPLPRTAAWIDVLAAGPTAQARVRLPLRWEYRS